MNSDLGEYVINSAMDLRKMKTMLYLILQIIHITLQP